jgi:hypothetical protein
MIFTLAIALGAACGKSHDSSGGGGASASATAPAPPTGGAASAPTAGSAAAAGSATTTAGTRGGLPTDAPAIDLPVVAAASTRPVTGQTFVALGQSGTSWSGDFKGAAPGAVGADGVALPALRAPAAHSAPGAGGLLQFASGESTVVFSLLPDAGAPDDDPLVAVDRGAPAPSALRALAASAPGAVLAVSSDGGAHARAFRLEASTSIGAARPPFVVVAVDATSDAASLVPPASQAGTIWLHVGDDITTARLVEVLDAVIAAGRGPVIASRQAPGESDDKDGKGAEVRVGQPTAVGDLDKAIIRRYVKRNLNKITACYEKQLLAKPTLTGTVATQFFIGPDGVVKTANASGVDDDVSTCIAAVLMKIEFPKPKGGGGVQVNYPFTFRTK